MDKSVDWVLIAKYMAGECSEKEKESVDQDPEMREMVASLATYFAGAIPSRLDGEARKIDGVKSLEKVHEAIARMDAAAVDGMGTLTDNPGSPGRKTVRTGRSGAAQWIGRVNAAPLFKIAAVIVVFIGVMYLSLNFETIFRPRKPALMASYEFATAKGGRKRLLLSDGTEITLNSESKIEIARSYGKGSRIVKLQGEAFFNVAHHKNPPFVVETSSGIIQDVGTEFNVKAWPGSGETQVAVTKGEIMLRPSDSANSAAVSVVAGQMSVAGKKKILLKPLRINLNQYVAWLKGAMVFDRTPFKDVLVDLGRQYPATFVVSDSSLLAKRVTASLARQPLRAILKAISVSLDIKCVSRGDTIQFEQRKTNSRRELRKVQKDQP